MWITSVSLALLRISKPLCDVFPVGNVPDGLDIVRTNILVLEVVGVLPYVDAEQRNQSCGGDTYNNIPYFC